MKRTKLTSLLLLFFLGILLLSCQKEEMEFVDNTPGDAITSDSTLAKLLMDASRNDGSNDDFIDGTPCSSIQMPFDVIVNGQTITVSNLIQLDALAQITSPITIVFPITVVFENYTTLEVNSQQELDALAQACETVNNAIGCIDIEYSVTFFVYNSNNEQTGTVVINSKAELFAFISGLGDGVYVALQFPVTVTLADGSQTTVTSNAHLEAMIEGCEDSIPDPTSPIELETILTTGNWFVGLLFDTIDETHLFAEYEFTFNSNGSATANSGSNTVDGSWFVSSSSSGSLKLNLDFGEDEPFDELEEDWKVLDFNNNLIRLKSGSRLLIFSRVAYDGGVNTDVSLLTDILIDGLWLIAFYLDELGASSYSTFQFNFQTNGTVSVSNNIVTLEGNWFVTVKANGDLKLILNFIDAYPLDELDNDWLVVEFQNNQVKLVDENSNNNDELIFEKL
jgi:hypothetical protein